MILNEETLHQLRKLSECKATEWIGMLQEIGEDPKTFFENGIWRNVDFSMSDMRRVSFRGAIVENCKFREVDAGCVVTTGAVWFTISSASLPRDESLNEVQKDIFKEFGFEKVRLEANEKQELKAFLEVLRKQIQYFSANGRCSFRTLTSHISKIGSFRVRILALTAFLEHIPLHPSQGMLNEVKGTGLAKHYQLQMVVAARKLVPSLKGAHYLLVASLKCFDDFLALISKNDSNFLSFESRMLELVGGLCLTDQNYLIAAEKLRALDIELNYHFLLKRPIPKSASEWEVFSGLAHQMRIALDEDFFTAYSRKAKHVNHAISLLKYIQTIRTIPRPELLNTLAKLAKNLGKLKEVLELARAIGLCPNSSIFVYFCRRANSNGKIEKVLQCMDKYGVKPDKFLFHEYAAKTKTLKQLRVLAELMIKFGLVPDNEFYYRYVSNARAHVHYDILTTHMKLFGLAPDEMVTSSPMVKKW